LDDLWKEAGSGSPVKEKAFVTYLAGLPEAIAHDELNAFSDERRVQIFKRISADGGAITEDDFKAMFVPLQSCVKAVVVTNTFEVEGSETVCKVEPNTEVVLVGTAKEDAEGLLRSECKVGEHRGWITIKQKRGPPFLSAVQPLQTFYSTMDKAVNEGGNAVSKIMNGLAAKMKQGGPATEGPLKDARDEMAKLKEKVVEAQKKVEELKKTVVVAKRELAAKEKSEANAHIEARNLKDAAPYLEGPTAKVEAVLAAAKSVEDEGEAMASLSGDELAAFATPASVVSAVEKSNASAAEKATEAREAIKEQTKVVNEVNPQTGGTGEAKKQLRQMQNKLEEAVRKSSKMLSTVKSKCASLVNPKMESTGDAIRAYAMSKKLSGEALFDELKDGDKITEEAFAKLVASLPDSPASSEIAKLICQKLGKDGISKDTFMGYVVIYYKVTTTIAFTDVMDIKECKTLRKASIGEVLEMIEGPVKDESSGVTRIRAKACKEPPCEGWVTLAGNQGSHFLEKTKKPAAEAPKK
jgi:predicted  nucleic acid-binding Zn-ribbon protein